jgi:hypothetical protein
MFYLLKNHLPNCHYSLACELEDRTYKVLVTLSFVLRRNFKGRRQFIISDLHFRYSQQYLVQNSPTRRYQTSGPFQRGPDDVDAGRPRKSLRIHQIWPDVRAESLDGIRHSHGDPLRQMQAGGDRTVEVEPDAVVGGRDGRGFGSRQVS